MREYAKLQERYRETNIHTFSNIASDIIINYTDEYVAVGDYYYSDGTWGANETKDECTTLGRVFKVGADETDDVSNYLGLSKIRGYVVCNTEHITSEYKWMKTADGNYKSLLDDLGENATDAERKNKTDYLGYKLTNAISSALDNFQSLAEGETLQTEFPLYYALQYEINIDSPENTSGWYIPSIAQLKDINSAKVYENFSGAYWSSNVYAERNDTDVIRIWALDYKTSDDKEGTCWASDGRKLVLVLTF